MRPNARVPGFTLAEILVVMVVGSLLLAAIYQALVAQQRGYNIQREMVVARQATRTALDVVTAEMREMSASGGDLIDASPGEVTFRAYRKLGIVCAPGSSGVPFEIVELGEPFTPGVDSVAVFVENNPEMMGDDAWAFGLVGSISPGSCKLGDRTSRRINVQGLGGASGIRAGAPVRSFEHLKYGRYLVDGEWVLGRVGGDGDVVPLIGPLAPDAEGLVFRYFDDTGAEIAPRTAAERAAVRRIQVEVRAALSARGVGTDSLITQIQLRGNAWQ